MAELNLVYMAFQMTRASLEITTQRSIFKRFHLIYHVYQRCHNHWFNSAISRIDVRFGIRSRNFCIYLHFGFKYFWDRCWKVGTCHATAQGYLRLLSNFQTTCCVRICWIKWASAATQNKWKLKQRSWFILCSCLSRSLACHFYIWRIHTDVCVRVCVKSHKVKHT